MFSILQMYMFLFINQNISIIELSDYMSLLDKYLTDPFFIR